MTSESNIYLDLLFKASCLNPEKEGRYRRLIALDPKLKPQIEAYLASRLQRMGIDPNNLPAFELVELEHRSIDILVGNQIVDKSPYGWSFDQLSDGHNLFLGATKSGKSTCLKNLFAHVDDSCIVWCFDFMNEYRQLLRVNPRIPVINWKNLSWNMLRNSKYIDQAEYIQAFVEVYSHSFKLLTGSKSFVHSNLTDIIDIYAKEGLYPTLRDFVEYLQNLKLKRAQYSYLPVNLIRFESICKSLGSVIDVQKGYLDELIDSKCHVIFELSGIAEAELQNFVVELLMTVLFLARRQMALTDKPLLIFIDEASRIFDRGKENTAAGIPTIDILTTQNRHSNIFIFASTQEISKLTNSLIANTSRKIIFKQNSGKDIQEIANALLLNDDQKETLLNLDIGEAVIKDGILPPFLIKTPNFPLSPVVTDKEIEKLSGPFIRKLMKHVIPRSERLSQKPEQPITASDDIEKQILGRLCENPLANAEEIIQAVNCNRAKFSRASESLLYKGLIKKIRPLHFKRGGGRLLFEPTTKARKLFERWGIKYYRQGKCGLESYYYLTEFVVPFYSQKEFKITWEGRSGDSTADLIVTNGSICLAIELQLTEKNTLKNLIRNNLSTGIDKTVVICKNECVRDRILKDIKNHKKSDIGSISVMLLAELVTENDSLSGI